MRGTAYARRHRSDTDRERMGFLPDQKFFEIGHTRKFSMNEVGA